MLFGLRDGPWVQLQENFSDAELWVEAALRGGINAELLTMLFELEKDGQDETFIHSVGRYFSKASNWAEAGTICVTIQLLPWKLIVFDPSLVAPRFSDRIIFPKDTCSTGPTILPSEYQI
eukprot:sb/3476197/